MPRDSQLNDSGDADLVEKCRSAVALLRSFARLDGYPPPLHALPPAFRPTEQRPAILRPHRRRAARYIRPCAVLVVLHVRHSTSLTAP